MIPRFQMAFQRSWRECGSTGISTGVSSCSMILTGFSGWKGTTRQHLKHENPWEYVMVWLLGMSFGRNEQALDEHGISLIA
jgi:hypothetical protein